MQPSAALIHMRLGAARTHFAGTAGKRVAKGPATRKGGGEKPGGFACPSWLRRVQDAEPKLTVEFRAGSARAAYRHDRSSEDPARYPEGVKVHDDARHLLR